jgi:DNA-binding MarR family transcriptional regulator
MLALPLIARRHHQQGPGRRYSPADTTSRAAAARPEPDGHQWWHYGAIDVMSLERMPAQLYALLQLVRPLHRVTAQVVADSLAGSGITVGGRAILERLHVDGPRPVPQLAYSLALPRQAVQRCANDLMALGLVTTAPNPTHRRSHLLGLTEDGARRVTDLLAAEAGALADLAEGLPPEDVDAAVRVLTLVLDRLRRRARAAGSGAPDQTPAVDHDARLAERS